MYDTKIYALFSISGSIDDLQPLRTPYTKMMRLSTDKNFKEWTKALLEFDTVNSYTTIIKDQKLDAICFDFMYCVRTMYFIY